MIDWAATCFIVALVAGFLGFTSITGPVVEPAQGLFYAFLGLAVVFYAKQEYFRIGIKGRPVKKRFINTR